MLVFELPVGAVRRKQFEASDAQRRHGSFEYRHDGRVAFTLLESPDILLRQAGLSAEAFSKIFAPALPSSLIDCVLGHGATPVCIKPRAKLSFVVDKDDRMAQAVDLEDPIMGGAQYSELMAFRAIYEARSFRDAALRLGVTPSALSRTLRRLEDRLGLRLLNRTTRSVSPTEAGALLYGRLVPVVASLEESVTDATVLRSDPRGTVRLNLPQLAAELILMPRLAEFCASYPGVRLDMVIDDGLTDVVAKGFDAGIRIGERLAQT